MALDHHQATPPAEVRFEGDHNKTRAMGSRKAPEAIATQKAPTQARAEIRATQQQVARIVKDKAIAASSLRTNTNAKPQEGVVQEPATRSNGRYPNRPIETKTAHPKSYVRNKASNDAFVNPNIDPNDADEDVENLDEVLGAIVNSPAIARRKAREALAAMEEPVPAQKKEMEAEVSNPLPIINPEALIASIREILALAQAKDAKKVSQSAKNATPEGQLAKPQDVLAKMNDMDNHLERAFNAMLNDQLDVADSARAALSRNFKFQALE
ncbi:MAG: hypothetical protein NTX63_05740 [Candidatus Peregrinibacteria bacterium]|nr:hypothetical protein [Candidatus Peregrinibacteria bacterium]